MAAGDAAVASDKVMALVEDLSKRVDLHDAVITNIVESIRQMVEAPDRGRSRPIGFTADLEHGVPGEAISRIYLQPVRRTTPESCE